MFERWQKDLGDSEREYIIDRIRSVATVRTMNSDGRVRAMGNMSKSLLTGELTRGKLVSRGYVEVGQ